MTQQWVSLNNHSQYSILNSTASVQDLVQAAASDNMQALALTDFCNLFGAVEFYKASMAANIHPIIGIELMMAPRSCREKKRLAGERAGFPLILLAKNGTGYRNLCKLSSIAYLEGFYYTPRIDKELLESYREGLICLVGSLSSLIGTYFLEGNQADCKATIAFFHQLFKEDLYFELQRHKMSEADIRLDRMHQETWLHQQYTQFVQDQENLNAYLAEYGKQEGIATVATNAVHYIHREDWQSHEILLNVQSGEPCEIWEQQSGLARRRVLNPKRRVKPTHELYFKNQEQMGSLFADSPQSLLATLEIAKKCAFHFDFKTKFYPVFTPPGFEGGEEKARVRAVEQYLRTLCETGIQKRYTQERLAALQAKYKEQDPLQVVKERLDYELEVIMSKGMCDYLLIVYDFIAWAKNKNIPVGPGRGSGVGSIILFLIGITDIEPLRFDLFFERFINPERPSYPDIDVDICMERRAEVIEYTLQKYGHDHVAQIITFGTMKAKMAVKDVGRVLNVPLAKVNQIAKLIPDDLNITLEKALEVDPGLRDFYDRDEEVKRVVDLAQRLEGCVRNTGIHAAGLIICGEPLTDHIPVCDAKESFIVATQYSMKPVEAVGMLKIDFLGLKTLTSIQKAADAVQERYGKRIDWTNLPLDDLETFAVLNQGKTLGIFQLESSGMQELAKQLHIDRFEEIIAATSLYRPGPMEMIPSFIKRKMGQESIEIDHPLMQESLSETYGIMVYQEQVMQIAQHLAKYSLGEGDMLRRAMGKKDHAEMARQREKFRLGAEKNGIEKVQSMTIFDKVEKFASYGFNKSHAAAYGYLSYVTAYFKAHYPGEWMAALMSCDKDDTGKVAKHIREAQSMSLAILPPDVNESAAHFVATPSGIRFSIGAIKGVGQHVVDTIVKIRQSQGPFASLQDFLSKVPPKKIGKKTLELLIESGCFDFTNETREALLAGLPTLFDLSIKVREEREKGILDFFSQDKEIDFTFPQVEVAPSLLQRLVKEKALLGFYITGHPISVYKELITKLQAIDFAAFNAQTEGFVGKMAFIVETVRLRFTSKGKRKFAILTISDGHIQQELPVWPALYEQKGYLLEEGKLLFAVVALEAGEGAVRWQCKWLEELTNLEIEENKAVAEEAYVQAQKQGRKKSTMPKTQTPISRLRLCFHIEKLQFSHVLAIKKLFQAHPGANPVQIDFYRGEKCIGFINIEESFGVETEAIAEKLSKFPSLYRLEKEPVA